MNKLQKDFKKVNKRKKENNRLRKLGRLGTKTGRLKVQVKKQKAFLNQLCSVLIEQKKKTSTSDFQQLKSSTDKE